MMVPVITDERLTGNLSYDIGDTEKLVKQKRENIWRFGRRRIEYGDETYSSGTDEKVADLGVLWNLRKQGPV